MKEAAFVIECHTAGHTYIIVAQDSASALDIENNGLVDVLYRWSTDEGPLTLEDALDLIETFGDLKSELEVHKILNEPRFSSMPK
jgi:hypothetical protein